jgi:hypothetical protein
MDKVHKPITTQFQISLSKQPREKLAAFISQNVLKMETENSSKTLATIYYSMLRHTLGVLK